MPGSILVEDPELVCLCGGRLYRVRLPSGRTWAVCGQCHREAGDVIPPEVRPAVQAAVAAAVAAGSATLMVPFGPNGR